MDPGTHRPVLADLPVFWKGAWPHGEGGVRGEGLITHELLWVFWTCEP